MDYKNNSGRSSSGRRLAGSLFLGWREFSAVGKYDFRKKPDCRPVLGWSGNDRDFVSRFQRILGPAGVSKNAGRLAFEIPVHEVATFVRHIQVNLRMGIAPVELRYRSLERDLGPVFVRRATVVCHHRDGKQKKADQHRDKYRCPSLHLATSSVQVHARFGDRIVLQHPLEARPTWVPTPIMK
jgi:hypothetical protein